MKEATMTNENPINSNLVAHAITELDRIGETSYEEPSMRKCVLDVVRLVADQGHSGFSAGHLVGVLDKLLRFKPLTPVTNDPGEWFCHDEGVAGVKGGLWQNKRDGECFSTDGGKTYRRNSENQKVLHTSAAMEETA